MYALCACCVRVVYVLCVCVNVVEDLDFVRVQFSQLQERDCDLRNQCERAKL